MQSLNKSKLIILGIIVFILLAFIVAAYLNFQAGGDALMNGLYIIACIAVLSVVLKWGMKMLR
jgi:uncharacterized membrane protein YhdT